MQAHRTLVVALLVAAVVAIVLAACGDDGDDTGADTTTTAAALTTTEPPATTPTSGPTATTVPVELGDEPPFHDDRASGSGCTPGSGAVPDGWWYVLSPTFDATEGTYTFDLACYYVGAAAEAEAAARGDEVNNDYYVVNDNPTLRTLPLADGATATCVELGAGVQNVDCSPSDIPGDVAWAVWLRVVDGEIDRLVEQYAP